MKGFTFASLLVLVVCVGVVLCKIATPSVELRKQLAGPPSEFAHMEVPDTAAASLRADSTFLPFTLKNSRGSFTWTSDYPVDTPEQITVTVLSPHKENLQFWLKAPNDNEYRKVDQSLFDGPLSMGKSYFSSHFGIDGAVVPSYSYVFYNPPTGYWGIIINSTSELPSHGPHGYLLLDNLSNYKILSKLNSYVLETGEKAGVTVQLIQENPHEISAADSLPTYTTVKDVITVAKLHVTTPSGQEVTVPLHDDGLEDDAVANDGLYTATITTATAGNYVFQPILEGILNQQPFARSVSHLVGVSAETVRIGSSANYRYSADKSIVYFDVAVTGRSSEPVLAYAQVWGQSATNPSQTVPVAWVESIVDVTNTVTLQLHHNWVVLAKAVPPFTLKQITLQDKEINTILSQSSAIHVKETEGQTLSLLHLYKNVVPTVTSTITEAMKYGPRPAQYTLTNATMSTASTGKLILVHGYCSGEVWDPSQFTNALLFTDYKQSRTQDQFALLIKKFAEETHSLKSYGIVGHSQGGLASVHLKAYYWSGLDNAQGNRVIQSVGSPYQGCSLAGTLADLGGMFGIGCSSNNDLAPNGAQVWLSKVPHEAQTKVFYYTTQYDDSWFLSPACVTASGMVLHSPNDGTCEIKFSTLDKAGYNMGTVKKFCHTDGMNYPPQTKDASRNAIMNREAAR
eukprot:TRINITY_DN8700_c0_g1_i1.p1 TRINITY_DN8700_c0_g1~~TRINITY_DN8700_c0_g1_i1.p1  ORF type:complete len:691 (-),score=177.39 TRINITY_DN8700_c0_g1_i1:108-2156(-)